MQYIYVDPVPSTTINFKVPSANTASRSVVLTAKPCFFVALSFCDHHDNCCTKNNSKTTRKQQKSNRIKEAVIWEMPRNWWHLEPRNKGPCLGTARRRFHCRWTTWVRRSLLRYNVTLLQCCSVAVFQMLQCCNVTDTSAVYQRVL